MKTTNSNVLQITPIKTLKIQFLAALKQSRSGYATLREAVSALEKQGVSRENMTQWGVQAGYKKTWVISVVGFVMRRAGKRLRKAGAGQKTPPEAIELASVAVEMFGQKASKMLLAAYRAVLAKKVKPKRHPHLRVLPLAA